MYGLALLAGLLAEYAGYDRGLFFPHPQAGVVDVPLVPEDDPAALGSYRIGFQSERSLWLPDHHGPVAVGLIPAPGRAVYHVLACGYAGQALDQLSRTWYATGMDRVLEVRKALQPGRNT